MSCSVLQSQKIRTRIHFQFILSLKPRLVILWNIVIPIDINPVEWRLSGSILVAYSFQKRATHKLVNWWFMHLCVCFNACVCINSLHFSSNKSTLGLWTIYGPFHMSFHLLFCYKTLMYLFVIYLFN